MSEMHAQVQQYTKMLKNLDRQLVKAADTAKAKKYDVAVLLEARLAPDMFPLMRQVQSVCDGAKFFAARIAGKDAPKHPDTEHTLEEIRARIQTVIEYLDSFGPEAFNGWESRIVPLGFMPGKGVAAPDWVREFNVPNTYFHLGMAYAILRHNGIDIGKTDFLGSLNIRDL
jgi:uncharacterized protein